MGCKKLTYHEGERGLEKVPSPFLRVLGKEEGEAKNRVSYFTGGMIMPGLNYSSGFYRFGFNGMEKDDEIKGNGNSLDFGARMLDVRLGRWFAVDPYADKYTEWSPYNFALDNPVKYVDEGGKYVVDPNFKIAYPKVSLILENADKLYNNQPLPPDVAKALRGIDVESVFNEKFRPALEKYSTLTNTRIQDVITPGQGPVISSDLLDDRERADPGGRLVNGKTLFEHDPVGNLINSNNGQGELVIDDDVAGDLEFELGGNDNGYGGVQTSAESKQAAFKVFMATVFHETVHFGRTETMGADGNDDSKPEQGN